MGPFWIQKSKIDQNPNLLLRQENHEAELYEKVNAANKKSNSGCDVRIIPTVFHIIHANGSENISDQRVKEYVAQVNDVWRFRNIDVEDLDPLWHERVTDMQVELRLAKYDPKGRPTSGIVRVESNLTVNAGDDIKSLSQWDPDRYLNIYIVRTIAGGGTTGIILGYAYFPWMEQRINDSTTNAGILIRSDVFNRQTLSHELGHYLDLYHPFQGSCGTSCQTSGDRVCDTPPVFRSSSGCNKNQNTCSNDQSTDERDMIENIMDYSDCRTVLTAGQKVRVDNCFKQYRYQLISQDNLYLTGALDSSETLGEPVAAFETSSTTICEGTELDFTDLSCTKKDSTDYKWFFPSGTPSAAFTPDPTVTYNKAGSYDVTLIIANNAGTDTLIMENYITVMKKVSSIKAPFIQDFSGNEFPYSDWSLSNTDNDLNWEWTEDFGFDGDGSLVLNTHNTSKQGETYSFATPALDLSTSKVFELNFDVAYSNVSDASLELLEIYAIDACRNVELLRFTERSSKLSSVENAITTSFEPTENQWKHYTVDMNLAKSLTSASIEFRFTSYGEQNIYIDNINAGIWPTDIKNNSIENIKTYPNPVTNVLTITGVSNASNAKIETFDLSGRKVSFDKSQQDEKIKLNFSQLQKGVYLVKVSTQNQVFTTQIVKD
ncbi:MAG: M43 family zinc metalloprotease [Bacteroidia bacterium]